MSNSGFYRFYNYGCREMGGTSRIGSGYRGVFAITEGRWTRVLDWSSQESARVDTKAFERYARPDRPRLGVVRRSLRGLDGDLATAARRSTTTA